MSRERNVQACGSTENAHSPTLNHFPFLTHIFFDSRFRKECSGSSFPDPFKLGSPAHSIIQDIERDSKAGSVHVAYFFGFNDHGKKDSCALLTSLIVHRSLTLSFRCIPLINPARSNLATAHSPNSLKTSF